MLIKRHIFIYGTVVFGLILIASFGAPTAHAQLGLGLVPMRSELRMAAGQEYSGSLKLSNQSAAQTRVRSETLDFYVDDKTTPQFERDLPQEAATSCKKWLTINPMEIELDPGGSLNVRYTIQVPKDVAEGSYNCAAGFTTFPPAEKATSGMGMQMAVRIVAAFYVVIGKPEVHGSLKEIKLEKLTPAKDAAPDAPAWQAVVVLQNTGKMYYRPIGKLEVMDTSGGSVETVEFPSLAVLRERNQRFLLPLKTHLDAGNYKLRVRVDIGTGEIQEGTVDVTVEKPMVALSTDSKNGK
jgi:hypothetical protein